MPPGPTVGYRISGPATFTYLPDHEPALGYQGGFPDNPAWISGFELAKGSDLLLHDAQYSDQEYETRVGWGHSTYEQALRFAQMVHTRHLVFFHHDPTHSDDDLYHLYHLHAENGGYPFEVSIGREGSVFEF